MRMSVWDAFDIFYYIMHFLLLFAILINQCDLGLDSSLVAKYKTIYVSVIYNHDEGSIILTTILYMDGWMDGLCIHSHPQVPLRNFPMISELVTNLQIELLVVEFVCD